MKFKKILAIFATSLLCGSTMYGATLAQWTFETLALSTANTNNPPAIPAGMCTNVPAESGSGTASGVHASAAAIYSTPTGNGSPKSFNANGWAVGDFFLFAVTAIPSGAQNFNVTFDANSSATGPLNFELDYSTDGINFTSFATYTNESAGVSAFVSGTKNPAFNHTFDLSSATALNNKSAVYFRLKDTSTTSANGGTVGTAGTARLDNVTVSAALGTPPNISDVSPSTIKTNTGFTVPFQVTLNAGDTPMVYFWYKETLASTNLVATFTNSSTGSTFTLTNVQLADAANYQVVASNATGFTAISAPGTLIVKDPGINVQPMNQTGLLHGAVQFSVSASSGSALSYQWWYCLSPSDNTQISRIVGNGMLPSGAVISGATSSTLMVTNLTLLDPTNFAVVVTSANGSVTSSVASFVVNNTGPLAFWNFNGLLNPTNPIVAEGIGSAFATNCNPFAQFGANADPDDLTGGGASLSWGTSNYPAGMNKQAGVAFYVSTVGAKNVNLSYEYRITPTASEYQRLQYTTDGGTTFIDYPASDAVPAGDASGWEGPRTYNLSGFPGVANNPNFGFRIVAEFEDTALYGTTNDDQYVGVSSGFTPLGTMSYDLVNVTADAITNNNAPPTIGGINNVTLAENGSSNITLTLSGDVTGVSAESLNSGVLGNPSASGHTLTVTGSGVTGVAPVLVTAVNGNGDVATTWFYVTVVPPNLPPTVTGLISTNTLVGVPVKIPFTIADDHTVNLVTFTLVSGNTTVLPNANMSVSKDGTGTNCVLSITNAPGKLGVAPITLTADDNDSINGALSTIVSFTVMVRPNTNVVLNDYFNYNGSGAIDQLSESFWQNHSGSNNELQVSSGAITIDGINHTEDINAQLLNGPYLTNSPAVLYSSFVINYQTMPDATGSYFAHFKNATNTFLCRIWASSNSPTTYQIGIGNSTQSTATNAPVPQSLFPGTNYVVVSRLVMSNGLSTVWVNPSSESSPGATDTTQVTNLDNISAYAFRESTADEGILTVSSLRVGTSFDAVLPALHVQAAGAKAIVNWSDPTLNIQATTNLLNPFADLPNATSPYTNSTSTNSVFYRFKPTN